MEKERQELEKLASRNYPGYFQVDWKDDGVYLSNGIDYVGVVKKGRAVLGVRLLKVLDEE